MLSWQRRVNQKRIASVRKGPVQLWQLLVVFALALSAILLPKVITSTIGGQNLPMQEYSLDGKYLNIEIADDEKERSIGLSGTPKLEANSGLLLSYIKPQQVLIWMKDMRISIDALWIAPDGRVVAIKKNISPDTYPKIFYSPQRVSGVLELPAGYVDANGIKIGSRLKPVN